LGKRAIKGYKKMKKEFRRFAIRKPDGTRDKREGWVFHYKGLNLGAWVKKGGMVALGQWQVSDLSTGCRIFGTKRINLFPEATETLDELGIDYIKAAIDDAPVKPNLNKKLIKELMGV